MHRKGATQARKGQGAQAVHGLLRSELASIYGRNISDRIRILYGGSVKPGNIGGLMAKSDIDGALVGGASLEAGSFAGIVHFEQE